MVTQRPLRITSKAFNLGCVPTCSRPIEDRYFNRSSAKYGKIKRKMSYSIYFRILMYLYVIYIYISCTCIYCKPPQRVDISHMCIYVGYLTVIRLQTYAYMSSKQGALFRTLKKSLVVVGNQLTILLWASIIFVPHTHAFEESIHLLQKNCWLSHFSSISSAWKKIQVCWKKTGKKWLVCK